MSSLPDDVAVRLLDWCRNRSPLEDEVLQQSEEGHCKVV